MARKPNFICEICGKLIYRNPNINRQHVTCSRECKRKLISLLHGNIVTCSWCGKNFYKKNSIIRNINFCCDDCYRKYMAPILSDDAILKLHNSGLYDYEIAELANCARSEISKLIKKYITQDRRDKIDDTNLRLRISDTLKGRYTGCLNPVWTGHSNYNTLARGLFSAISSNVRLKRNFECAFCGSKTGDKHVHHIKPFSIIINEFLDLHPDITLEDFSTEILQYKDFIDEDNLLVLCKQCHIDLHKKLRQL